MGILPSEESWVAKLAKSSSGGDPAAERRLLPNRCLTTANLPKPFQSTLVSFLGYGVPLLQCIIAKSNCACSAYFTANCKNVSRIFSHLTSILYLPQSTFKTSLYILILGLFFDGTIFGLTWREDLCFRFLREGLVAEIFALSWFCI